MSFQSLAFDPRITAAIQDLGYAEPTPIQKQAIPVVLDGRDVVGMAQTGTGKTAAFALPILQRLLSGPRGRIRALILAPTRELAEQTHRAFAALGRRTGIRSATVYGGVAMGPQTRALRGADIVVACPGRLLDHLTQRTFDLSRIEVLVLDEADRMLDMGFLPDVRRIVKQVPAKRQTLVFSATMPAEVRRLAREILADPIAVEIGRSAPAATVSHAIYPVDEHRKAALLLALLGTTGPGSVLVFTRTKHRAERVSKQLARAGHSATSLQGNLSQGQRQRAISGFRDGSVRVLVATDIAARGIDVSTISHVINYDLPDTVDAYTHRIGRTGRAERSGEAFTFIGRNDGQTVQALERALGARIERRRLEGFEYDVPAPVPSGAKPRGSAPGLRPWVRPGNAYPRRSAMRSVTPGS
jgi:ATP-dependent RNA helicase RhlE